MNPQYFKGDSDEKKMDGAGATAMDLVSVELDAFFEGAFACHVLNGVLFDDARAPLANAIRRDIFVKSYAECVDAFEFVGTFEAYLTVFRKVFGDDVTVTFDVPDPGKLTMDIEAASVELFDFISRTIVDGAYVYDEVVDEVGDNIAFAAVSGFTTQYELEQMLKEMVPAGIYADISLEVA
jgi:hypothetical protein